MATPRPPNPSRLVIENDADGNSFFSKTLSEPVEVRSELGGGIQRLLYQTERPPISLNNNVDIDYFKAASQGVVPLVTPGGGTTVWYNDIPPGTESSSMHRTVSFDIVIILLGEVELTLSNGETRTVGTGDMVIQRSTLHKWRNPSATQWARMVAFVSECQPYVTARGVTLGAEFQDA